MPRAARAKAPSDTPERILAAALDTFSQKGFEGAKTRDIAARAGVTLGLVQYHFGTKDELWKAAVERAFADFAGGLDRVLAGAEPGDERELLAKLIRTHVEFVAHNTEFIRIMHDEGKQRSPRMRWLADRYVKPLFTRVTPFIASAQEKGILLAGVDPAHFVYILVGAVGMFFHQAEECKRVAGVDPTAPAAIEAHGRAVESIFLGHTTQP